MTEKTFSESKAATLQVSEQDLRSTLNDFLENDEKKQERSIWNIKTIAGLAFVLFSFAYLGNFIGAELFNFSELPLLKTIMAFAPYLAGALIAVEGIGWLKRKKQVTKASVKEETLRQESFDNLDKFLYPEGKKRKYKSSKSSDGINSALSESGKLMRSRTDSQLFGVCGGLAKHLNISSTVLRIIFVAATIFGYGSFFLVYIAMAIVMPKEPVEWMDDFN